MGIDLYPDNQKKNSIGPGLQLSLCHCLTIHLHWIDCNTEPKEPEDFSKVTDFIEENRNHYSCFPPSSLASLLLGFSSGHFYKWNPTLRVSRSTLQAAHRLVQSPSHPCSQLLPQWHRHACMHTQAQAYTHRHILALTCTYTHIHSYICMEPHISPKYTLSHAHLHTLTSR